MELVDSSCNNRYVFLHVYLKPNKLFRSKNFFSADQFVKLFTMSCDK